MYKEFYIDEVDLDEIKKLLQDIRWLYDTMEFTGYTIKDIMDDVKDISDIIDNLNYYKEVF